jgi:predicted site-specific integrase-resolvase
MGPLLTLDEAAQTLRISLRTLQTHVTKGEIATTSNSEVVDFAALRAQRQSAKQKPSSVRSAQRRPKKSSVARLSAASP